MRPVLEKAAMLVAPGKPLREIVSLELDRSADEGWVCLMAGPSTGIAFLLNGLQPCSSTLSRALSAAQLARRIKAEYALKATNLLWNEAFRPAADWLFFALRFEAGECLCACSRTPPELSPRPSWVATPRTVRGVQMLGTADSLRELELGVREISVQLPALRMCGVLRLDERGDMRVGIEGATSQTDSGKAVVRLDLGEIELGLSELFSLRPGSVIELGALSPLPCTLLIGTTSLARGTIEGLGATFRVRITEGFE